MDKREDQGDFYPGGKVIPKTPVVPIGGGDMKHSEFANVSTLSNATLNQVSAKINELIGLLKPAMPMIVATLCLCAFGDLGPTTPFGDVPPSSTLSQVVTAGGGGSAGGITTNDVNAIIASSNLCTVAAAQAMTNGVMTEASGKFLKTTNEEYGSSISWVSGGLKISGDESWFDVGNYFSTSAGGTKVYGWDFLFDRNEESLQDALDEKLDNKDKLDWVSDTALRLSDAKFIAGNTTVLDENGLSVSTWNNIVNQESTPYTLGGVLNTKANSSDVYTKTQIDGNAVTNGGAKAYADATFLKKTGGAMSENASINFFQGNDITTINRNGISYSQELSPQEVFGTSMFEIKFESGQYTKEVCVNFRAKGKDYYDPWIESRLTPDDSIVLTENVGDNRYLRSYTETDPTATTKAQAAIASTLSGRVYDFDHGSNFTKRVYAALTNVIQTLGGTVANPPNL